MRIRQLAEELGVGDRELLALVRATVGTRFKSVEDPLPDSLGELVRVRAKDLPRLTKRAASTEVDASLLQAAYAGVKPLGAQPKLNSTGPRSVAATVRPPVAAKPSAAPVGSPAVPVSSSTPGGRDRQAAIEELRTAERDAAVRELGAARREIVELKARIAAAEAERDAAKAALAERVGAVRTIGEVFARRGLRGEDEVALALRAILDARREGVLLKAVRVEDEAALTSFLEERLVLLGEGEEVPSGAVAVRVAPERSEGNSSPAMKAALSRFSTLCLVRGWRRVTFIGLSGGQAKRLREGLDSRLQLTFLAAPRDLPADIVLSLVPAPGAVRLSGRTLPELLQSAAAGIDAQ